jgi:hypothetical protein
MIDYSLAVLLRRRGVSRRKPKRRRFYKRRFPKTSERSGSGETDPRSATPEFYREVHGEHAAGPSNGISTFSLPEALAERMRRL